MLLYRTALETLPERILEKDPTLAKEKDNDGSTPMDLAAATAAKEKDEEGCCVVM